VHAALSTADAQLMKSRDGPTAKTVQDGALCWSCFIEAIPVLLRR
jgi:hypothetical protein